MTLNVYTQVLQRKDRDLYTEAFDRLMADAIPSASAVKIPPNPAHEGAAMPPNHTGFAPEIAPETRKRANRLMATRPNHTLNEETPAKARVLRVELAGLEPATSWVRSRRSSS